MSITLIKDIHNFAKEYLPIRTSISSFNALRASFILGAGAG